MWSNRVVTVPRQVAASNESNPASGEHLRLVWPQWQGGGSPSVRELASEFPFDVGRRGYAVGSAVLEAILPAHHGPSATVPVTMTDDGLEERDGGLTSAQVQRVLDDLNHVADIVGLTIAEFIPRQVMHLQQILKDFPLINGSDLPIWTPPRTPE